MATGTDEAIVTEGDIVYLIGQNFLEYHPDRGGTGLTASSTYCFTYGDFKYWVRTGITLAGHPNNQLVTYGIVKSTRYIPSGGGPGVDPPGGTST